MELREILLLQITAQLNHMAHSNTKGRQSAFRKTLLGTDNIRSLAELILDHAVRSLSNGMPLTSSANLLAKKMNVITTFNLKSGDTRKSEASMISAGVEALGTLGSLGYITMVTETRGAVKLTRLDFANETSVFFDYYKSVKTIAEIDLPKEDYTYWTHPWKNGQSIVKKMPSSLSLKYQYKKMPKVYQALNAYGDTEFSVNLDVLNTVMEMDRLKHGFIPSVVKIDEVSVALKDLMKFNRTSEFVGEQAKKWYLENVSQQLMKKGLTTLQIDGRSNTYKKRKASGWLKDKSSDSIDIVRASSKRYEFGKVTDMAHMMLGKSFHYDFQLDSRGRFYPIVNYFEPTGSDLAKGLLTFTRGVPVTDKVLENLAVHTANCMGEDKLSMEDRILFVWVHMDEILEASEDLINSEWLQQFKDDKKTKFQLISAILEWKKYHEQGDDYVCHLPIGLDATNSGLQILSAMTRDRRGAEETNVIQHPSKEIGDAYMVIAKDVLGAGFNYKGYENLGDKAWRKLCKRPTMSYYYDAGRGCIQEQTFEDRRDHGVEVLAQMGFDDASYIGTAIFDGVEHAFPRQTQAKEALKLGVKTTLKDNGNKPIISWKTASGFTAFQNYSKSKMHRVNCTFAGKAVKLSYLVQLDEAMKSEHDKGISANFVHSQDASLLTGTIANLNDEGIEDFMMIHDQFSVNAESVDLLLETFKDTFRDIFTEDQLGKTLESLGLEENPVEYGDLDIDEVLDSNYIIS